MSKKISEIYKDYKIMPILEMHMLRVAGVAGLICDSFTGPLDKEAVISACLLHDMGNIIKSDLGLFPEARGPEGLEYWQKVKEEYITKYGNNEHKATIKILEELGVADNVIRLVEGVDFSEIPQMETKSIEQQICLYADARVDPFAIVSFRERLAEGRERYKNKKHKISDTDWDLVEQIFRRVEAKIFAQCKIKPEDIHDKTAAPVINQLRNFVIK